MDNIWDSTQAEPEEMREEAMIHIMRERIKNNCVDQTVYPYQNPGLTPRTVLNCYSHLMSPFENIEVEQYGRVYTLSTSCDTLNAPKNALEVGYFVQNSKYKMLAEDHIAYRYLVENVIGEGRYGVVGKATDCKTRQKVAVKIVSHDAPRIYGEVKMLLKIQNSEERGHSNIIRMFEYNHFRNFHYVALEVFETDMKKFIANKHPDGIPAKLLRPMARSILSALEFLDDHDIVHCDVKPSNVYFNLNDPVALKLGDFGLSRLAKQHYYDSVRCQDLFYRAPEAFVYGKASSAMDMWSFGCTLVEMITGKIFLRGENKHDQFYLIQEVLGPPPPDFHDNFVTKKYFHTSFKNAPRHVVDSENGPVVCLLQTHASETRKLPGATPINSMFPDQELLNSLIQSIFKWLPEKRIKAEQAYFDWFFSNVFNKLT